MKFKKQGRNAVFWGQDDCCRCTMSGVAWLAARCTVTWMTFLPTAEGRIPVPLLCWPAFHHPSSILLQQAGASYRARAGTACLTACCASDCQPSAHSLSSSTRRHLALSRVRIVVQCQAGLQQPSRNPRTATLQDFPANHLFHWIFHHFHCYWRHEIR